ncbi:MAG: N-acetyltransferase [Bifidobacteriaceae bacterium]|jgi:predicted GNAT family acetyltransferase|nr:N-acetyltransferase [Bifidobacteriaceae bacterium]
MSESPQVAVHNNQAASRYEITVDGKVVGLAAYSVRSSTISFVHTEVTPELSGLGLASTLIKAALKDARQRGLDVLPYCEFVRHYISTHPEEIDLVPAIRRPAFGLPAEPAKIA